MNGFQYAKLLIIAQKAKYCAMFLILDKFFDDE